MTDYRRGLAYKAGVKAHQRGKPRTVCNRQAGTIFFDDWNDGYSASENGQVRP